VQFKINPTTGQKSLLNQTTKEYITSANSLIQQYGSLPEMPKLSSASFNAALPSAVKNEVINTVKSAIRKYRRGTIESLPVLRKPVSTWNNQNYRVLENEIQLPVIVDGKSKRISVSASITEYQRNKLDGKHGSLRITQKNGKWIAQVSVEPISGKAHGNTIMGIDLGLKNPAVAVTDAGKTKFFGNGRQNKYMKRKFRAKRKALGKAKKQKAIEKLSNKEQRWMKDQDHKISRDIINFAKSNDVSVIHMEQLQNIRNTARTSRKNEKNLHTWSFYRLAMYIAYKAALLGIAVVLVNPAYTSQTCPVCSQKNLAKGRKYTCRCGFMSHRDRVGAINIISAPVASGNRTSA
jgi:IS605 OrfB family transposase